jgi:hypothetical protein
VLLSACSTFTGDFSAVVAIEYTGPLKPAVEEGDTLTLTAVALDAGGNPLPDVPVIWHRIALDTATVTFTVDSLTGLVTGVALGTGRVQGDADGLRTDTLHITILGVPDSIAAVDSAVTVDSTATESPSLVARVMDVSTTGVVTPLANQTVQYMLVSPAPGTPEAAGVAIAPSGQEIGTDPYVATTITNSGGLALVTARRVGTTPDTAIVDAIAITSKGVVVPGPPARFYVLFVNN